MAQKVLIARDEIVTRDNLPRPNCNSDGKANNKRQAFINTDTMTRDILKFRWVSWDLPPAGKASYIIEL